MLALVAAPILALTIAACSVSVSTAHIGSLKIGSEKGFTTETTTFGPQDTVYAQAEAANVPSAVSVKWQVVAENVTGQQPNTPIPALDQSFDVTSDSTVSVTLTPPTAGWPTGTYRITVTMMDGTTQRDQKSEAFTVN